MTRSKSPWSSFRFKKSKKDEAEVAGGAAGGGAEAVRDYLEEEDAMRTIGKLLGARAGDGGIGFWLLGDGFLAAALNTRNPGSLPSWWDNPCLDINNHTMCLNVDVSVLLPF